MTGTIHLLSGVYAVDALDPTERAAFEAHLAGCPDCTAEVDGLRAAAAELAGLVEAEPPASVRAAVLADIARVRPLAPRREAHAVRRGPRVWLAAAAVAAAVGAGVIVVHPWENGSTSQMSAIEQVLHAPDATRETVPVGAAATATVVRSPSRAEAVVIGSDLPTPRHGRVYQLWFQRPNGKMVPAGFLAAGPGAQTLLSGDAATAVGAGITVEPSGGSARPTTKTIALFSFKSAT